MAETTIQTPKTRTFLVEVGRYINKAKELDFPTYTAYVGKNQKRINLRFRKDCKNIPTETGYLTVLESDLSIDTRYRYPRLWVANIQSFSETINVKSNEKDIIEYFGKDSDLPF